MAASLTRNETEWVLLFLNRTVPKGHDEEEAAVRLIAKLEESLKPRRKSTT